MKISRIVLAAVLSLAIGSGALAQTATKPAPATTKTKTTQAEPWKAIPIPPLNAFHAQQPKRIQLDNGLVIFLQEDHELPFVDGFFEMRGGSRNVDAAKSGMISLYGETWRTSGTPTIDGDKMDDILEARAATIETSGGLDSTRLSWSCLKGDLDKVFDLAVDLLNHPAYNDEKLNLAKQQMAASIVRRNDDASGIASREAAKLAYGATSPYARQPEFATVMSIGVDDLKAWHDKTVAPNNMIIGVVGDFDSAAMEKKLRAAFESMPKGTVIEAPKVEFPGPKPGVYFVEKADVNQSNLWIVGMGTLRNNPDYVALQVMNEVFSGGFGSRLFQDVRTKQGLAYSVGGSYGASYDHPGMFYSAASTKSESTVKATKAILAEINDLKTKPFTETEVKNAKDQILNSFIFSYDSKEKVLAEQVRLEFYGYPADFLEKYREGVDKITAADLARVAKKYIDPSKLAILVVGNSAEFGTALPALGTVTPIDVTIPMPAGMGDPAAKGKKGK